MTTRPSPVTTDTDRRPDAPSPHVPWAGALAGLSLLWLLATLSSVRQSIGVAPDVDSLTVVRVAVALPPVITASLVAGVAVGLVALSLLGHRWTSLVTRAGRRYGTSTVAGLLLGAVVATPIALGYEGIPSLLVVCGTVVATGGLGGLLAGAPYREVVAAGVLGSLAVFLVGFGFAVFDGDLLTLFGAGDTEVSVLRANAWVAFLSSLTAGLAAGVLAYVYLRRYGRGLRWPAYLVAGAAAGVLVLLAEAATRLGGAHLFRLVSAVSADRTYLQYLGAARINRALLVLFVGALVAIFLLGRSLTDEEPPRADAAADGSTRPDGDSSTRRGADDEPSPRPGADEDGESPTDGPTAPAAEPVAGHDRDAQSGTS